MTESRRSRWPRLSGAGAVTSIAVVAAAFAFWLVRFPYDYGYGDQDEFLPYLLHLLDSELFRADWYVQTQLQKVGVRTYFVFLLRGLCEFVTPRVAVAIVFGSCWIAIALGVIRLTRRMGGGASATLVAVFGVMCLTPKWTLGGNDLVYTMLVPEMVAWVFVLFAVLQFASTRYLIAGVLLGVAAWFQLLAGILTAGLLGLVLILPAPRLDGLKGATTLCASTLAIALPVLIPVALQQFISADVPASSPGGLFILAEFRAPHHYLPSAFSASSWLKVALLAAVGGPSAWWITRNTGNVKSDVPAGRILYAILIVCLVSWLLTEIVPVEFVVKLQLFKLTVLAKLLLVLSIAVAAEVAVVRRRPRVLDMIPGATLAAAGGLLLASAGILLAGKHPGDAHRRSALWRAESVETWARESSPVNAVFALPPSNSSFRTFARRAIVVNYGAVPFAPGDLATWYERLHAIAPVETDYANRRVVHRLDSAYHSLGASEWLRLADTYDVDYLVRRSARGTPLPFQVAFRDSAWVAFDMRSATHADSD